VSVIRHLLTGKDGVTHDLGRWSWVLSFFVVAGDACWHAVAGGLSLKDGAPSVGEMAAALGVVAGAHGLALFAKAKTEPQPTEPQ
jgi:hypothetical protein